MVARHQQIYKILAEELDGPVHALVLQTLTKEEWQQSESKGDDLIFNNRYDPFIHATNNQVFST